MPQSLEGKRLLELFALPHVWVTLSGPYRVGNDPMNTRPDKVWLRDPGICCRTMCLGQRLAAYSAA